MYLCYIDESGTSDIPGNTSHFILAGLSIPIHRWKTCDYQIERIKRNYGLRHAELHIAWMLRAYREQATIPDFESLSYASRRAEVLKARTTELLRLQRTNQKQYKQTRKNYKHTEIYVHLTLVERQQLVVEVAQCVSRWRFARLFAECIDKLHFPLLKGKEGIDEQSLEQIVSRFEHYLRIVDRARPKDCLGLLIHDNNQTVAHKHTQLMKKFHDRGTWWTPIRHIIETPLFVDSQLTSMVQIADLCAYALRRYLENSETYLFDLIFQRADRKDGVVVGVRHYGSNACSCKICIAHRRPTISLAPECLE